MGRVTQLPPEVTDAPSIFEIKTENFEIIRIGMGGDIPYGELALLARQFEDKLEQNEELAELRADTSLAKQQMSNEVKIYSDRMKRKDVKTLKGPRR